MFEKIEFDNWDRKEIYEAFKDVNYFVTVEIDITKLYRFVKNKKIRFYPAAIYCISKLVNENKCFRYAIEDGKIGYWDKLNPLYTLLRKNSDNLFTHKITEYVEDFDAFYKAALSDIEIAEAGNKLYFDNPLPHNHLCISVMPKTSFSGLGFMYNVKNDGNLAPFITIGKYFDKDGKIFMPVAVEFYHEVNDGYHADLFFEKFQQIVNEF